jgi:hypothetical protein
MIDTWFHITRFDLIPTVIREGLRKDVKNSRWDHPTGNGVYLYEHLHLAQGEARGDPYNASVGSPVAIVVVKGLDPRAMLADEDEFCYPYGNSEDEWLDAMEQIENTPYGEFGEQLASLGYRPYEQLVPLIIRFIDENRIQPFGYRYTSRFPGSIPARFIHGVYGFDGSRTWLVWPERANPGLVAGAVE